MRTTRLTTLVTVFLRSPSTQCAAFCVATAAAALKLLPIIAHLPMPQGISLTLTIVSMLALALLWLVLSRMFTKEARLMRYATFALASVLVLHAAWTLADAILYRPMRATALHDSTSEISYVVAAAIGNIRSLLTLAVSLLLVVRYRGRLRQLGVLLVSQTALACVVTLVFLAFTSLPVSMKTTSAVSSAYIIIQSVLTVITPLFLWRAIKNSRTS